MVSYQNLFLPDKQVAVRYGVNRSTIWRWVSEGHFPSPVRFAGCTRWRLSDLENWERAQCGQDQA